MKTYKNLSDAGKYEYLEIMDTTTSSDPFEYSGTYLWPINQVYHLNMHHI